MQPYYEHGGITIFHGDCRDVLPMLSGIDCIVTSPPYNQLGSRIPSKPSGFWAQSHGGARFVENVGQNGYADDMDETAYQAWQNALFGSLDSVCHESASLFYNHQLRWRDGALLHPVEWFRPGGWRLKQELIWDRGGGMMFNARMFCRFEERILWFTRGSYKWTDGAAARGSVWRLNPVGRDGYQKGHPVEYPVELPRQCIVATTEPGDLVLDPFMGSGTTIRAAKDLGRRAIGIEIEERFCEIAARRLAQEVLL